MMIWILCLLIGSITCSPVLIVHHDTIYNHDLAQDMVMDVGVSPEVGLNDPSEDQSVGYDDGANDGSSATAYAGNGWYGYVTAPQVDASAKGYGATDQTHEPVFSDLSYLDPVYSVSSRSRYQRGRAVFAQTQYTPGATMYASYHAGNTRMQHPAKASSK